MPVTNRTAQFDLETHDHLPRDQNIRSSLAVNRANRADPSVARKAPVRSRQPSFLGGSERKRSEIWNQPHESESFTTG